MLADVRLHVRLLGAHSCWRGWLQRVYGYYGAVKKSTVLQICTRPDFWTLLWCSKSSKAFGSRIFRKVTCAN